VRAAIATAIPAVLTLAIAAAIGLALVAFETVAYADYRDRVRHG
jgi:hypothetical protein